MRNDEEISFGRLFLDFEGDEDGVGGRVVEILVGLVYFGCYGRYNNED